MDSFDFIRKSENIKSPTEGYVWFNMLIKFNLDGTSEIVRSYTQPAKDSYIKKTFKKKPKVIKPKIETNTTKTKLF